jgi:hypothetical protein
LIDLEFDSICDPYNLVESMTQAKRTAIICLDVRDYFHVSRFLNFLPQNVLQSDSIGCEFRNTLAQLLHRHLFLVEVEAEGCLVVDVALLWNV